MIIVEKLVMKLYFGITGFECGGEVILMIIKYVIKLLNILYIIVPIGLILMATIDLVKNVIANDDGEMKKNLKIFGKRFLMCIAFFLVEPIVTATVGLLGDAGLDYANCIDIALKEDLSKYRKVFDTTTDPVDVNTSPGSSFSTTDKTNTSGDSSSASTFDENTKKIIIGDSRCVGMKEALGEDAKKVSWICESGKGYNWFSKTAVSKLDGLVADGKNYNVIINLGVNDLHNIQSYITKFNQMLKDDKYKNCKFIIVSVNPVDEAKEAKNGYSVKNSSIENFNTKMRTGLDSSIKYCDVYSDISKSFDTRDGLHYTASSYKNIYSSINKCLSGNAVSNTSASSTLESNIKKYLNSDAEKGTWAVYVRNLKKNEIVSINGSSKMNSASVIKLFVLASAYDKVNAGSVKESTISADAKKMIENSDNVATNKVIKAIGGMNAVNSYIGNNYSNATQLNRLLGGNYTNSGVDNYTSAKDVAQLLEKIYKGTLVSKSYSKKMLEFLKNQQTRSKIPAGVPNGTIANKTGEIPDQGVQNDAAIVYTKGTDYVLVVLSKTSNDSNAIANIKEISSIVYRYYNT